MKNFFLTFLVAVSALLGLSSLSSLEEMKGESVISYYADKFNGKKTASGQSFDNSKFTAAHRILPFGTKVKFINLKNNKSVIVTVNDRGPFHKNRQFDVTKAAFNALTDTNSGILKIAYAVVEN